MSVLKNIKNSPRSPSHRATGPKCNFFLQICNEVPGEKNERGGLSPTPGATGSIPPIYKPGPPFLCHLSLKIQEKREG